ncbi:ADP-ribosylglycohydrolase family protein [Pendulispora brunnea]|uniref:ADP-ribosylglycohydrolase family protein n=1 Tax=Pendulispora brunnea TaxID=2905690 RepID=A0ABZ2KIK9_9BACT
MPEPEDFRDRIEGVLLGTAIGDALGLPMEGMGARAIARSFAKLDRYFLLGKTGFVSDDTEQTALVAQSLARNPRRVDAFVGAFRRALLGWFLRLPWGIGLGTLRACVRISLGLRNSGVRSAGNGAAMRAAIVGAFFCDAPAERAAWADALSRVTHTDVRAVQGARFVAELASRCVVHGPKVARGMLVRDARAVIDEPSLCAGIERACALESDGVSMDLAAAELGNTGFVLHTTALATFAFLRFGDDPERAMVETIRAGGDTDSNAAIVGAWAGALHGARGLPARLVDRLHDGPFGPTHLRALAADLACARSGEPVARASYSWIAALVRNLVLYPVVLAHAVRVFCRR